VLNFPAIALPVEKLLMNRTQLLNRLIVTGSILLASLCLLEPTITLAQRPSGGGKPPGGRQPAGSRPSTCFGKQVPLALTPDTVGSDRTTAQYPTFFVQVPPAQTETTAEFALLNDANKQIYRTPIALTDKPGISSFRLPIDTPGLEVGKTYRWFFLFHCGAAANNVDSVKPDTQAWITRVEAVPTLTSQLGKASGRDRARLYQHAGLWYEALSTLADLRRINPQDSKLQTDWTTLLQTAGLEAVATEPLVP